LRDWTKDQRDGLLDLIVDNILRTYGKTEASMSERDAKQSTRVFKRKGEATARSVNLSLSFPAQREAERFAHDVDRLKMLAAYESSTLSRIVADALFEYLSGRGRLKAIRGMMRP
jgi:hypothetical protein